MKKILIVDDDPGILRLISTNLEARGYEALTFNSGTSTLAQLDHLTPDLVILDIMLPGVDGIELLARAREMSRAPIMMISAKEELDTKLVLSQLGFGNCLRKRLRLLPFFRSVDVGGWQPWDENGMWSGWKGKNETSWND